MISVVPWPVLDKHRTQRHAEDRPGIDELHDHDLALRAGAVCSGGDEACRWSYSSAGADVLALLNDE